MQQTQLYRLTLPTDHPAGGCGRLCEVFAHSQEDAIGEAIARVQKWPYWIGGCGYTSSSAVLLDLVPRQPSGYTIELLLDGNQKRVFTLGSAEIPAYRHHPEA